MGRQAEARTYLRAFGKAVRQSREQLGISQEELGYRAELDRTYISGIERGGRNPTLATIHRLGRALKIRPSALLKQAESRR